MRTTTSVPHSQTVPLAHRWRNLAKAARWPLSAAAAVLLAVGLLCLLVGKSASPAYAISQTIEAFSKMRSVHICVKNPDGTTGSEKWVELDENGVVRRVRDEGKDSSGNSIIMVLNEDTKKEWKPNLNELRVSNTASRDRMFWTSYAANWLDPSRLLKHAEDGQAEGVLTLQAEMPKAAGQPITVTVTPIKGGDKWTMLIDPDTKLVLRQDRYGQQENRRFQFDCTYVYLDYNRPIDPARFALDVPTNAKVVDESEDMTGVGLSQGTMTEAEAATAVVRQYMDALLAKDYTKAASLSGNTVERTQQWAEGGSFRVVRVILAGPAAIDPELARFGRYYNVPFEYEIELKDGTREIEGPAAPDAKNGGPGPIEHRAASVRQVPGHPDRWVVWAGI